jgi:hypothetical protein
MNSMLRPMIAMLVLAVVTTMLGTHPASAACGVPALLKPSAWKPMADPSGGASYLLRTALYRPDSDTGALVRTGEEGADWQGDEIVGMWRFTFSVAGPNGSQIVVDDGYSQWHSDGTEIMNSGTHAPLTSNFCLGVWKRVGSNKYQLNHFPLAWDATGAAPAGPVHIIATVTLTDHDHFSGSFTLDVYNWDGNEIVNAEGPPVVHATGTLSATRVTIDSKVPGT